MNLETLALRLRQGRPRTLVVAGAAEGNLLESVARAADEGIAEPVLVGDRKAIEDTVRQRGPSLSSARIIHQPDEDAVALAAMEVVASVPGSALMKGTLATPTLMRVALRNGLRNGDRLLSHIAAFERFDRLVLLTDSGLIPYPTYEQRLQILDNAIASALAMGIERPNVALLSANEEVNEAIPCSVHYARLTEEAAHGRFPDAGGVFGPVDLFASIDPDLARKKKMVFAGAGHADILHCPDVVAGNLMGKSITYFGGAQMGGCIVGGTAPVVLLSRVSSPEDKYASIVVGLSCAG